MKTNTSDSEPNNMMRKSEEAVLWVIAVDLGRRIYVFGRRVQRVWRGPSAVPLKETLLQARGVRQSRWGWVQ
jgi:hypothetical protein